MVAEGDDYCAVDVGTERQKGRQVPSSFDCG